MRAERAIFVDPSVGMDFEFRIVSHVDRSGKDTLSDQSCNHLQRYHDAWESMRSD